MKFFITSVLKESVEERPDAMECVRILMNALYEVPLDGVKRINELERHVRENFQNPGEDEDDRSFMTDCYYMSLSELL